LFDTTNCNCSPFTLTTSNWSGWHEHVFGFLILNSLGGNCTVTNCGQGVGQHGVGQQGGGQQGGGQHGVGHETFMTFMDGQHGVGQQVGGQHGVV
jgi:hypothetical protein